VIERSTDEDSSAAEEKAGGATASRPGIICGPPGEAINADGDPGGTYWTLVQPSQLGEGTREVRLIGCRRPGDIL
jgi:hypothetical protein